MGACFDAYASLPALLWAEQHGSFLGQYLRNHHAQLKIANVVEHIAHS